MNEEVMILMVRASEKFKKKSSAILRRHGLPFSHYLVLKTVVACEHGQDTIGNLSKKMPVAAPHLTRIVKRMEKAGLIERKNDAPYERLIMLKVTPRGRETLGRIREIQEQHCLAYLEIYSPEQKEEIFSILNHIVQEVKQLPNSFS